jgi:DNA modification methylase
MFTKENDLILDPFIGSGSTAVACVQLKRNFIGFEIEEKYCKISLDRINKFMKATNLILLEVESKK